MKNYRKTINLLIERVKRADRLAFEQEQDELNNKI